MKRPVRRWWSRWAARLSRPRLTVRDAPAEDQLRILAFADRLGPTLQINWMRPLAASRRQGRSAVWLVEERQFEARAALLGASGVQRDLDALFRELRPHLVAVSRYGGPSAKAMVEAAKRHGIPLVFHIDDNLLAVDPDIGAAKVARHAAPQRIAALKLLMTEADLVYVSTEALRRQLDALGLTFKACHVGAIAGGADVMRRRDPEPGTAKAITIGYMASSSHVADLAMVMPALLRILDERPEVRVEVFGSLKVPEALAQKACRAHPPVDNYDAFLDRLASMPWDIGLAPLRTTEFNLAKTNTKWIEYAAAGIPVICSDHPVYRDVIAAGGATPAADDRWYDVICAMIDQPERRRAQLETAQRLLEHEYSLQRLRAQLADVISRLGLPALAAKLEPAPPRQA